MVKFLISFEFTCMKVYFSFFVDCTCMKVCFSFFVDCTVKKMDLLLNNADHFLLTPYIYPSSLPEDNPLRQIISLFLVTNVGGFFLYFLAATLSYVFVFDKRLLKHPLILQVMVVFYIAIYYNEQVTFIPHLYEREP